MNFNKQFFAIAILFALSMNHFTHSTETLQNTAKSELVDAENLGALKVKYQVVGKDMSGNDITFAYVETQTNPHKPTIVCADPYLGYKSWDCLIKKLSKDFNIIAYDPIGTGASSQNTPTNLDGVIIDNVATYGYSYEQQARLAHQLIKALNITTPIVFCGIDAQGNIGIQYASLYANDQYQLNKLIVINAPPQSSTGDEPCKLRYLTTAQAQGLADFYRFDRCGALCLLLKSSFAEPACPKEATALFNEVVNFSATQSADIFERTVTKTIAGDVSGLMGGITIPVLYLYSVVDAGDILTRQTQGMVFTGFCPSCKNPAVCSGLPYVQPFPNCQFHTLAAKGVLCNRTDSVRVNRYIKEFILEEDIACQLCTIDPNIPVVCPVCA